MPANNPGAYKTMHIDPSGKRKKKKKANPPKPKPPGVLKKPKSPPKPPLKVKPFREARTTAELKSRLKARRGKVG